MGGLALSDLDIGQKNSDGFEHIPAALNLAVAEVKGVIVEGNIPTRHSRVITDNGGEVILPPFWSYLSATFDLPGPSVIGSAFSDQTTNFFRRGLIPSGVEVFREIPDDPFLLLRFLKDNSGKFRLHLGLVAKASQLLQELRIFIGSQFDVEGALSSYLPMVFNLQREWGDSADQRVLWSPSLFDIDRGAVDLIEFQPGEFFCGLTPPVAITSFEVSLNSPCLRDVKFLAPDLRVHRLSSS